MVGPTIKMKKGDTMIGQCPKCGANMTQCACTKTISISAKGNKLTEKPCYECQNYNHVDCVKRKKRPKSKSCGCWCNKKSSKYVNIFPSKKTPRGIHYK